MHCWCWCWDPGLSQRDDGGYAVKPPRASMYIVQVSRRPCYVTHNKSLLAQHPCCVTYAAIWLGMKCIQSASPVVNDAVITFATSPMAGHPCHLPCGTSPMSRHPCTSPIAQHSCQVTHATSPMARHLCQVTWVRLPMTCHPCPVISITSPMARHP